MRIIMRWSGVGFNLVVYPNRCLMGASEMMRTEVNF